MRFVNRYDAQWKPWFAWRPVRITLPHEKFDRTGPWVWLERIERKRYQINIFHYSEYRLPSGDPR